MKNNDERHKAVRQLPGDDYILALRKTWAHLSEPRTDAELLEYWFTEFRWNSRRQLTTARSFLSGAGFIEKDPNKRWIKPSQGDFDTDGKIVLALHKRYRFIGELLEEVASPKLGQELGYAAREHAREIGEKPQHGELTSYEKQQISNRVNWLRGLGMLKDVEGGKLLITEEGEEFLASLDEASSDVGAEELPLNTILYGPPGTGKTYATFQRCVKICDGKAPVHDRKATQSRYKKLVKEGRVEFVTFHQSYGYEEFVEGLRPDPDGEHLRLLPVDGVLKRIAERARKRPELPYVLVIDEINRANVSKVLGELITLLEKDKREGNEVEVAVTLPHSGKRFTLPSKLYILGTMNTADRSIALIDTALRRRFRFEEVPPEKELLGTVDGIDLQVILETINDRLEYLIDRDHLIGHAWLMGVKSRADLDEVMRHKIIPLIAEYFYEDWGKVQAVLGGTGHFVVGRALKRPPGLGDEEAHETRRSWEIQKEFAEGAYESLVSGK